MLYTVARRWVPPPALSWLLPAVLTLSPSSHSAFHGEGGRKRRGGCSIDVKKQDIEKFAPPFSAACVIPSLIDVHGLVVSLIL
jgi:hypothetical protein